MPRDFTLRQQARDWAIVALRRGRVRVVCAADLGLPQIVTASRPERHRDAIPVTSKHVPAKGSQIPGGERRRQLRTIAEALACVEASQRRNHAA